MEFIVETSARHAHISKEHLEILFGKDAELVVKMKEMDRLHNSLLSETINTCSGISRDLDTIKALITGTIVSRFCC